MIYLVDGYNLLHALGAVSRATGPADLAPARLRLLRLLHEFHAEESPNVTVVFDARRRVHGTAAETTYCGLRVRFAVDHPEADDLLEELISQSRAPSDLTVVSNDHRVRRAARRHGGTVLSCGEYMDRLGRHERDRRPRPTAACDKPDTPDEAEAAYWRQAFAALDNDPGMRELFELPWSEP